MNTTSGLRDTETTLFQKRLARGDFLRLAAAGMGISLVPPLVASVGARSALGATATEPSLTLVSIPDFVNVDVGDVSGIQGMGISVGIPATPTPSTPTTETRSR